MCESTVIIEHGSEDEEVMIDVVKAFIQDKSVFCINVTGETKEVPNAMISRIDSLKHLIILKEI
jgi:predicted RNA-binding protein